MNSARLLTELLPGPPGPAGEVRLSMDAPRCQLPAALARLCCCWLADAQSSGTETKIQRPGAEMSGLERIFLTLEPCEL